MDAGWAYGDLTTSQAVSRRRNAPLLKRGRTLAWLRSLMLVVAWLCVVAPVDATESEVLIFAAASLKPALDEISAQSSVRGLPRPRISYAASSQLARQIEHGARADLFISADRDWMDHLVERERVRAGDPIDLLGNELVLIAPLEQIASLRLEPGVDLVGLLGDDGRLAMAEPNTVPAGRYGRAALTWLGIWDGLRSRIVAAENVRAALNFVRRREAPLGIVYRSDAVAEPSLQVLGTFPAASHPAIVYPAAVPVDAGNADGGRRWLAYLRGPDATAVFTRHGFNVLASQPEQPPAAGDTARP